MAGLKHLKDLLDSKGLDFIKKLFTNSLYATEKIDGSRFSFKKESGELIFYKRDSKNPISILDRTMMAFYESAITHVESLNLKSIPEGIIFGFEYFANSTPGSIVYDRLPKNGLILTDISNGGSIDTNIDTLLKYAKLFKTDPPPIVFNGTMSASQKDNLIDFLTTDWEDLFIKFKTESFTSYLISILNPKLKNTALNIGISNPIEGFVFSFNSGGSFINAKLVDPLYTQKARERTKSRYTTDTKDRNSELKTMLRGLISFTKTKAVFLDDFKSKNKEIRYVELLSDIFFQYYVLNKSKFSKIILHQGGNSVKELDVNYKFITNPGLKKILKSNEKVKMAFKSFLLSFGKSRKRGTFTLDKSMVSDVNGLITKLKKISESFTNINAYNSELLDRIVKKTTI